MKSTTRLFAALAAASVLVAACGNAPEEDASGTDTGSATASASETTSESPTASETASASATATSGGEATDVLACEVTDSGGVDDRSFNQTAFKGLQDAESEFGITAKVLESNAETDFEPNIQEFVSQECNIIVTVGFLLGDATEAAAQANPDTDFAIVDFGYETKYDNLRELTFETDQAAFLAGYVAAGVTETGTVGTYGGINIPTVSIFMDGMLAGVRYYNEQNGTDVNVIGWDGSDGLFTGDFQDQDKGRSTTDQLLQQGADIVMPVAGPVGLGSAAAMQDAGTGKLIWVDTDGFVSAPQFSDLMLTSVQKNIDVAVKDTVQTVVDGNFEGGTYSGTLENDGVGIAEFHDFEDAVPQEVKDALETIREGIISGEISVKSADYAA